MTPECTQVGFEFQRLKSRSIRAQFDGGAITSDGGGLLLREVEKRTGILRVASKQLQRQIALAAKNRGSIFQRRRWRTTAIGTIIPQAALILA